MSLDKDLDVPEIRRLIYLLEKNIKSTQFVMKSKINELSGEDQARMVRQIEFDEKLIKILQGEL